MEPVDISVYSNSEDSFSVLPQPDLSKPVDIEEESHLEKEKEKEKGTENITENAFAAGQQLPVSTSPVNSTDNTANIFVTGGL